MVQGADSIKRCYLTSIGNPILELRWSCNHPIFTMGFHILVRRHLYIESEPGWLVTVFLQGSHDGSENLWEYTFSWKHKENWGILCIDWYGEYIFSMKYMHHNQLTHPWVWIMRCYFGEFIFSYISLVIGHTVINGTNILELVIWILYCTVNLHLMKDSDILASWIPRKNEHIESRPWAPSQYKNSLSQVWGFPC